jgi:hypothetical protein
MKTLHRKHMGHHGKKKSAKNFKRNVRKTKSPNMQKSPQRGGWRL